MGRKWPLSPGKDRGISFLNLALALQRVPRVFSKPEVPNARQSQAGTWETWVLDVGDSGSTVSLLCTTNTQYSAKVLGTCLDYSSHAPKHIVLKNYLQRQEQVVWPPQSHDLNIMESVFYVKRQKQLRRLNQQNNCGNFCKILWKTDL